MIAREFIGKIVIIFQSVSAAVLIILGVVLVFTSGFPASIGTLSTPTATTGFTLFGIGVAIGSFAISEDSQKELLEEIRNIKNSQKELLEDIRDIKN